MDQGPTGTRYPTQNANRPKVENTNPLNPAMDTGILYIIHTFKSLTPCQFHLITDDLPQNMFVSHASKIGVILGPSLGKHCY